MKLVELNQSDGKGTVNSFYVSFSDLMLLLCAFFVMIIGMSKIDIGSFEQLRAGVTGNKEGTLVELAENLQEIAAGHKGVTIRLAEDGVRLDFESAALFDTGKSILKEPALKPLAPVLAEILQTDYTIDVEGHTDDRGFHRRDGDELLTNWSLSGRRASATVHYLLDFGFPEKRLRIVGYAANKPTASIIDKKGEILEAARAKNRRVSLLVK